MFQTWVGNPYNIAEDYDVICITTNGETRANGRAVMGRGNAKFARDNFENIDAKLGNYLKCYGNRCFNLGVYRYKNKEFTIASFPTKRYWRYKSDPNLIEKSAIQIVEMANKFDWKRTYVPITGCGNGGLKWSQVKGLLQVLDDRFVIYSLDEKLFAE